MAGRVVRRGRKSFADQKRDVNVALRFLDVMYGDPTNPRAPAPEVAPKRTYKRNPDARLEKHVLADVLAFLKKDPRVARAERTQSGVFMEGGRTIRVGTPGKLDITGMLVGGRYFELEVKRPGGRPDPRQAERIAAIKANGGIAGYADCVSMADLVISEEA